MHLKVTFSVGADAARRIADAVPSARVSGGRCTVSLDGEGPSDVAAHAREMLDKVRKAMETAKDFKQRERPQAAA